MKTVDAGGRLISVITDHPRTHALHSAILLKHVGGTAVLFDVCTRCNSSSETTLTIFKHLLLNCRPALRVRYALIVDDVCPSVFIVRPVVISQKTKGAFIATQLNSTSSCRHVHGVNCHRSVLNVVTQLTQFVGHDVIYDVFWRVSREMELWSEKFEEELIELWKKTCLFIWHIDQSLRRPCKKAAALENISQEMNVAGWYITHHNAALGTKTDWPASRWLAVRCSTGSVALPIVGDSWVASVRASIATQLISTQLDVELCRYKRALSKIVP